MLPILRGLSLMAILIPLWAASPSVADPLVPRLDGITLDGDGTDWANRGLHLPFLTPDSDTVPNASQSHASAQLGWDGTGLLVLVKVTDTTPSESHYAAGAYECDSVELFLALDPARSESMQWVISPGHDAAHPAPRIYPFDNRPPALQSLAREATWMVRTHAAGYTVEARLPWSCLGIAPAAGSTVATRLFVNELVRPGQRTRFAWQPAPGTTRFLRLVLGPPDASSTARQSVAWLSMDPASDTLRLNAVAPPDFAGDAFVVCQGNEVHGKLNLTSNGPVATGSLVLPALRPAAPFALTGPDRQTLELPDTLSQDTVARVMRATAGWRVSATEKAALAFARIGFVQHVFAGPAFPAPVFADPARLARLLGAAPSVQTTWLDAGGKPVASAKVPGLYAARTEVTLPGRSSPWVLEHLLFRLPDGATLPPLADETAAQQLAFGLQGADATPTQAARTAERWWHRTRRTNGWSTPLPFELHAPPWTNDSPRPLLVYLHGTGQNRKEDAQKLLALLASLAPTNWILAYPRSNSAWRGPAVADVIDTIAASHAVDTNRIYLMGFSMGGIGSWEVALDQPDRFAAVVPTGGRMGSPADAPRLRDVPLWVFNGADDPTTTCEEAQMMVDALTRAGGRPVFTRLPGKSHGDSQEAALRYPGLFDWLGTRHRSPSTR